MNEFPKMLYKLGDEIEWEGLRLATIVVESAEHEAEAVAKGFMHIADILKADQEKVAKKKAALK